MKNYSLMKLMILKAVYDEKYEALQYSCKKAIEYHTSCLEGADKETQEMNFAEMRYARGYEDALESIYKIIEEVETEDEQ